MSNNVLKGSFASQVSAFTINMNKISPRAESNAKLLQILSKRTEHEFLVFDKTSWPGLKRPSFTSTIRIRNLKQSRSTPKITHDHTRRTSMSIKRTLKANEIISSSKSLSLVPKTNRAMLSKIRSLTGRSDNKIERKSIEKVKNVQDLSRKSANDDMEGYEVDYMAFNFIGKVIDTPELWAKYVHKKTGL